MIDWKSETNHYRQKVRDHEKILDNPKDIFSHKWKWNTFFGNDNEIVLEIGTGLWNFFSSEVGKNPNKNYIWKEIRYKRLYVTAEKCLGQRGDNFILLKTKWENIVEVFWPEEISLTYVFFPDPWANKTRQMKHRIFSKQFITNLYNVTKQKGRVIFKTDHREYFDSTLELLRNTHMWQEVLVSYDYENELDIFDKNNMTEFEEIFREERIKINYLEFQK